MKGVSSTVEVPLWADFCVADAADFGAIHHPAWEDVILSSSCFVSFKEDEFDLRLWEFGKNMRCNITREQKLRILVKVFGHNLYFEKTTRSSFIPLSKTSCFVCELRLTMVWETTVSSEPSGTNNIAVSFVSMSCREGGTLNMFSIKQHLIKCELESQRQTENLLQF